LILSAWLSVIGQSAFACSLACLLCLLAFAD
jgi:hypothetical protein